MALPLSPAPPEAEEELDEEVQEEEEEEANPGPVFQAGYARLSDYQFPNTLAAEPVSLGGDNCSRGNHGVHQLSWQHHGNGSNGHITPYQADSGGTVTTIDEFLVYKDISSSEFQQDPDALDSEEEQEEERQRARAEMAIREANETDTVRRSAPLPPERCSAIKDAMKGITLGGFRPDWADRIPEEQWVGKLRSRIDCRI